MPILPAEWEFMQPSESCKMAEVVRNRFRAWINEILRQLASPNLDWDSQESVFYRVETLYNTIVRFDGVHGIDDNVVNHLLREVRDLLSFHSLSFSAHVAERLSLVSVVDQNIFRWILQVNFAQREEGWPPSHEACKKNCCLPPSCSFLIPRD